MILVEFCESHIDFDRFSRFELRENIFLCTNRQILRVWNKKVILNRQSADYKVIRMVGMVGMYKYVRWQDRAISV